MGKAIITRRGLPPEINNELKQLINYTMLYDHGDECVDVTGGLEATVTSSGTYTKNLNNIYVNGVNSSSAVWISTENQIDTSEYTALLFISNGLTHTGNVYGAFGLSANRNSNVDFVKACEVACKFIETAGKSIGVLDISANQGLYYPKFGTGHVRTMEMYSFAIIKPDDYEKLCTKAGVEAPATLAELIADSSKLTSIFNSKEAVTWMCYNCTGDFMVSVLNDETARGLLQASPHLNTVIANPHWAKFIQMIAPELLNYTMLYDHGDECTEVTGGWENYRITDSSKTHVDVQFNEDHIYCYPNGKNKETAFRTVKEIDNSGYPSIFAFVQNTSTTSYGKFSAITHSDYNDAVDDLRIIDSDTSVNRTGFLIEPIVTNTFAKLSGWFTTTSASNGDGTLSVYIIGYAKSDDWQTWASKGGVTGFEDLDTLLADSTAMAKLMANEAAVKYLVGCTGDLMIKVCNSEVAMAALCDNIAYDYAFNHPVWYKFMTMIPTSLSAMDNVAVTVPTMTSNTTPNGIARASSEHDTAPAYFAFDNQSVIGYQYQSVRGQNAPQWVEYEFEEYIELYKVMLHNPDDLSYDSPMQGHIDVSDDGVNYNSILKFSNLATGVSNYLTLKAPIKCKIVRVVITAQNSSFDGGNCRCDAQFYGKAVTE